MSSQQNKGICLDVPIFLEGTMHIHVFTLKSTTICVYNIFSFNYQKNCNLIINLQGACNRNNLCEDNFWKIKRVKITSAVKALLE